MRAILVALVLAILLTGAPSAEAQQDALPVVGPSRGGPGLSCLQSNPSCGRDPWWIEWNEIQSDRLVRFSFLPPGLVAEARFIEAIWLLSEWDDGRFLLEEAGRNGLLIITAPIPRKAFAAYLPAKRLLGVNERFAEVSTWMLADVLAHELKHAADHSMNVWPNLVPHDYEACWTIEKLAYEVEQHYLQWVGRRFGGLPSYQQVGGQLSEEDQALYANLRGILDARDLGKMAESDYRGHCRTRF